MAYRDFTYPEVLTDLRLRLVERPLFTGLVDAELKPEFIERWLSGVKLASAINTEKAKSEFIIAPLLLELLFAAVRPFGLFSGIEFNVDAARGLNGFCDFLLTASTLQTMVSSPVVAVVEAKNDNLRSGFSQCIASMTAAREFNAKTGGDPRVVYGVVTTGAAWKFLSLDGDELLIELSDYYVADLSHIFAVMLKMVSPQTEPKV